MARFDNALRSQLTDWGALSARVLEAPKAAERVIASLTVKLVVNRLKSRTRPSSSALFWACRLAIAARWCGQPRPRSGSRNG